MAGEKRSHDEMEAGKVTTPKPVGDATVSAQAAANPGMLGLPFMLPSAAHMAVNTVQQHTDQSTEDAAAVLSAQQQMAAGAAAALAAATTGVTTAPASEGDKTDAHQQQAIQQQLQLLQQQQQQLQQMSPSELTTMAAMAHQMALGMVMMPAMMPLMMVNQNGGQASPQAGQESPGRASSEVGAADSLGMIGQGGDANAMPLMAAAAYGMGNDDTPKRKRGRPPKKDVLTRPKLDGEKALKQFPLWGYGMPLPFLPGFAPNTGATTGADQASAGTQDDASVHEGEDQANSQGKSGAKKKTRGTGKPRGRPRTRPRPGDVIQRVKPPPIAPANLSGMQEYLVQKLAEWKATQGGASSSDDGRVGTFSASLGDHE